MVGTYFAVYIIWMELKIMQGFTISLVEWEATIPTLWQAVKGLFEVWRTIIHSLICLWHRLHFR